MNVHSKSQHNAIHKLVRSGQTMYGWDAAFSATLTTTYMHWKNSPTLQLFNTRGTSIGLANRVIMTKFHTYQFPSNVCHWIDDVFQSGAGAAATSHWLILQVAGSLGSAIADGAGGWRQLSEVTVADDSCSMIVRLSWRRGVVPIVIVSQVGDRSRCHYSQEENFCPSLKNSEFSLQKKKNRV